MTKVVILSDTHNQILPDELITHIDKCDIILHAGDITGMDMYDNLCSYGKDLKCVLGNMDEDPLAGMLPVKRLFKIEGLRVAMIHGWGAPHNLETKVRREFDEKEWDILIFGHSHAPVYRNENGKIVLNPGSPTDKRFAKHNSFIWAEIDDRDFHHRFVEL